MKEIQKNTEIRVYNEMPTQINLEGQFKSYIFPASIDGNPTMNYVEFGDIEFANSRSNVFSVGLLVFDEDQQEEVYKKLRLNNWKDTVWFDKDIEDAIENPTLEKIQRIINVTSLLIIERIRGKVVYRVNNGMNVSNKVIDIVDKRYRELSSGILKSSIVVRATDVQDVTSSEVAELKKQIEEMKKLMINMSKTEPVTEEVVEEPKATKPRTRKKTATQK